MYVLRKLYFMYELSVHVKRVHVADDWGDV